MSAPLKIVIFDGTLKTTTFINRLVSGLSKKHDVYVFGYNEELPNRLSGITYVPLGSKANVFRLAVISLKFAFKILLKKGAVKPFFKYFMLLLSMKKQELVQLNLSTAFRLVGPDVFHIQWPSLLPVCQELIKEDTSKFVLSQRGYQNNVRPFVDDENFKLLESMYPKIHGFHSVSQAMNKQSNAIYSHPNKIDDVVYTGFDFALFPFRETYSIDNPLKILSIGRPHWKKGFNYAIRAMEILKQNGVNFTYEIVGGEGDEELLYCISDSELTNEVVLLGKISQDEVYKKMNTAALFLLPSLEEGLPNVMVEAMAIGLPVIATDCGGVSELIDESTGIILPSRDASQMAEAIISFTESPLDVINERRVNARERVQARHSEQQMVQGMEALYYKCL